MTDFRIDHHPVVFLRPNISPPYSWVGHIPLAYLMVDLLKPRNLVELGTDTGNSYLAFCQAVAHLGLPTRCFAIDTWEGDEHARFYGEAVYGTLKAYHDPRYGHFSDLLRGRFEEKVSGFEDGSVDVLHIDGLHTYEAVKSDFETWQRKLSKQAVVLFHDSAVKERGFGVGRFLDELRPAFQVFDFFHSNGLSIVQVGECPPHDFVAFMHYAQSNPNSIRSYFEAVSLSIYDPATALPVGGGGNQQHADARLYFRRHGDICSEVNSVPAHASFSLDDGRARLGFMLPAGAERDVLRFDPASVPGIFNLSNLCLIGMENAKSIRVDPANWRLLHVNGDVLTPQAPNFLRLASLHADPGVEFIVDDLLRHFSPDEAIELVIDVDYEAVINDPVAQYVSARQSEAYELYREKDRSNDAASKINERLDGTRADLDQVRGDLQVLGEAIRHVVHETLPEAVTGSVARMDLMVANHIDARVPHLVRGVLEEPMQEMMARLDALEEIHKRTLWRRFRALTRGTKI